MAKEDKLFCLFLCVYVPIMKDLDMIDTSEIVFVVIILCYYIRRHIVWIYFNSTSRCVLRLCSKYLASQQCVNNQNFERKKHVYTNKNFCPALLSYFTPWNRYKWYQSLYNVCMKRLLVHAFIMAKLIVQVMLMCFKSCILVLKSLILDDIEIQK